MIYFRETSSGWDNWIQKFVLWIVSALQYRQVIDDKYVTASLWEMLKKATLTDHDVIIGVNQMDAVLIIDSYSKTY